MSWELLPVNYTDAVWSGLKISNVECARRFLRHGDIPRPGI